MGSGFPHQPIKGTPKLYQDEQINGLIAAGAKFWGASSGRSGFVISAVGREEEEEEAEEGRGSTWIHWPCL